MVPNIVSIYTAPSVNNDVTYLVFWLGISNYD
jgi:hypothetical protein